MLALVQFILARRHRRTTPPRDSPPPAPRTQTLAGDPPFWRRLLCAPELPVATAGAAASSSPPATKSVFAAPPPLQPTTTTEATKTEVKTVQTAERIVAGWRVSDTRRMGASCAPRSARETLLSPQRRRTQRSEDLVKRQAAAREDEEETEDDGSFIEGDDNVDLQDLNRLYDYYKRKEGVAQSSCAEGETITENKPPCSLSSSSSSSSSSSCAAAVETACTPRKTRCYELHSRKYTERVILSQRSQQKIALFWLLAESKRHAWKVHLRLVDLYVNYVPVYLQALAATMYNVHSTVNYNADGGEDDLSSITKNKYYKYFCSGTFDYDYDTYEFNREWEMLFGDVQNYLSEENNNCTGRVGYAATLLYSMELFERQYESQVAVREVERWLHKCWRHMTESHAVNTVPAGMMNTADNTEDNNNDANVSTTINTTTINNNNNNNNNNTEDNSSAYMSATSPAITHSNNESGANVPSRTQQQTPQQIQQAQHGDSVQFIEAVARPLEAANKHEDDLVYIPMDWWAAQDADTRARVSWNRKRRKLRHVHTGMNTRVSAADTSEDKITSVRNSEEDECNSHGGGGAAWMPDVLDAIIDVGGDEEPKSHRVVNVGCFGFSFFSRWD